MDSLLLQSATSLARGLRARRGGSLELVEAHLARIERFEPTINALVATRFDEARAEAREADRRLAAGGDGDLPPLLGVPCTIKEAFALQGMPNTSGLVSRRGVVASRDATAVARLRAAGAIPLGVTNVSELCMWMESHNKVWGRTRNPYDPRRIVGGSSGGEGAIVASGGSPFGLGSDIGGSIRLPAMFNGVFGHKPTGGLVPGTGQFPISSGPALRYLTTGPLARCAEDLMPLLRILAGPDGEDAGCRDLPLGDPAAVDLGRLRVLDVPDNGSVPVHPAIRHAQRRCVQWLGSRGARVERVRIDELKHSLPIWSAMMAAAGGPSYRELLAAGGRLSLGRELLATLVGRSPYTVPSLGLALIEKLPGLLPGSTDRFVRMGESLRSRLGERLGGDGVMVYPTYPQPAPRHRKPLLPPFNWVYTAIVNVLELPSTHVPMGLDARGLPVGVQVIGGPGSDHVTIAVAQALERAFGGWVPPLPLRDTGSATASSATWPASRSPASMR